MSDVLNIDKQTLETIDKLMRDYADQVDKSDLSGASKSMYVDFANCFVRWIHGDFNPGSVGAWKRPKYPKKSPDPQ